jgi:hypothetical protein
MTKNYGEAICDMCESPFTRHSNNQIYCNDCKMYAYKQLRRAYQQQPKVTTKRHVYSKQYNNIPEVKERAILKRKAIYKELREKVLNHYGHTCNCCGITESHFLTIEHIKGNGHTHRKQIGQGIHFLKWIITNNYPNELGLLCYNCNCAKGHYGICPHKEMVNNAL